MYSCLEKNTTDSLLTLMDKELQILKLYKEFFF